MRPMQLTDTVETRLLTPPFWMDSFAQSGVDTWLKDSRITGDYEVECKAEPSVLGASLNAKLLEGASSTVAHRIQHLSMFSAPSPPSQPISAFAELARRLSGRSPE